MKENKNTPDWLKNAKKSIEEFENSKYGKMTDGQLSKSRSASANGIGKQHTEGNTKDIIKKAMKTRKNNGYYNSKSFFNAQSKAGKKAGKKLLESGEAHKRIKKAIEKSLESRSIHRDEKYTKILDYIKEEEFTSKMIENAIKDLGYEKGVNIRFMISNGYIEVSHVGGNPRWDPKKYKRTNSKKDI